MKQLKFLGLVSAALLALPVLTMGSLARADDAQKPAQTASVEPVVPAVGSPAKKGVLARVDLSAQMMEVWVDGILQYSWRVSTGQEGYTTPTGDFKPIAMTPMHYSTEYELTPMPYSIFFKEGGFAIHGTSDVARLGRPASHGCVRLEANAAKELYKLVKMHGEKETEIVVSE